jgi:hypothetical protein
MANVLRELRPGDDAGWPECRVCGAMVKGKRCLSCGELLAADQIDPLYEVAKRVCHEYGLPWTDPRTGVTYLPPKQRTQ